MSNNVKFLTPLVLIPLLFMAPGCAQDSIFYNISTEVAPTDPLIVGGPTKIVEANGKLYVANGNIYEYALAGNGAWVGSKKPGGKVQDLAVVSGPEGDTEGDTLYALSVTGSGLDFRLWEQDGDAWKLIGIDGNDYTVIQNIFGGGDKLFAGLSKSNDNGGNDYAIYYEDGGNLHRLPETTALLSGAGQIGTDYYLATMGSGIYKASFSTSPPVVSEITTSMNIAGFLQADPDLIIAATRDGYVLCGTSAGFTSPTTSLGVTFTGAIAKTTAYDYSTTPPAPGKELLLLGIQGGYREVDYDGGQAGNTAREPGRSDPTGIAKNENYRSTLRKYPVTAIVSLPQISQSAAADAPKNATDPIMFASTPKDGFYSYRNRPDGGWQWNHEE